ncbi:hypothetical protein L873DRAFT_1938362 [Choiromyces venosus 120613-1]|uniref:CCHC-type domain-containing protein n=1 Tax=Choiromyces venosus 120613-1 TaxID=1336337 RepID=A0A3N4K0P8_9PEZI|nr:hypothetical protein L873DRAFT_1938362 [Choiromyces venosus 120613-1]
MLSLAQGEVEHICRYVHCVEKLSRKVPVEMNLLFEIAFIKGMKDQDKQQCVTFDLKNDLNFSFSKALTVVKFAFQEIGEPDPFCPQPDKMESVAPALYSLHNVTQVNALTKTEVLVLLIQPTLTQEQFNTLIASYEASMSKGLRVGSGGPLNHRRNLHITCFNCGQRGHYSDTCHNTLVLSYEQQSIRDTVHQEREL